jgi:hypothetical protein
MSDHLSFPLSLSVQNVGKQSADSHTDANALKRVVQKVRNKKIKEKQIYDILKIDEQIKECFKIEQSKLPEYNKRLSSMIWTLDRLVPPYGVEPAILDDVKQLISNYKRINISSHPSEVPIHLNLSYKEFLNFYEQVKRLLIKIDNISSDALYNKYLELTHELLEKYRHILTIPVKSSFLAKSKQKDHSHSEKLNIQTTYLNIAKNFANIEYDNEIEQDEQKYECPCGNSTDFEVTEGYMICEKCAIEIPTKSVQSNFKDVDRIHLSNKYRYEKRSHFMEAIRQFQGKQIARIDPSLYVQAEQWLDIHGLTNRNAKTKLEKYANVKKDHVRMFISESQDPDITRHYDDLKLIHSIITDRPCPDISHLEEKLMMQFDKLVDSFLSFENIERTNFLNSQFVLRELLIYNKYKIDPDDFPGLKTPSRQAEHQDIFQTIKENSGMNNSEIKKKLTK